MEESVNEMPLETEASEETAVEDGDVLADGELLAAAEALRSVYPDFDLSEAMKDPVFSGMVRGESRPTLRQIYELCRQDAIVEARVSQALQAAVDEAVSAAVQAAVSDTEQNLLSHIRARGQRPTESGLYAAQGIRTHPAVSRLTRDDRAKLAKRASRGETIRL